MAIDNAGTGYLSVALAHADMTGTSSSCMNVHTRVHMHVQH